MNAETLGPYRNLQVWQDAIELTTIIYNITKNFPREEMFGIVNQMRRSAVSIPSNIAEGYGRSTNAELIRFLYIALGSSNELDTQIEISKNLKFINDEDYTAIDNKNAEVNAKLRALIKTRSNF